MGSRIGAALRVARAEAATSQRTLAAATGLTQAQLSQFERGERPPSLREFARLVAVYPSLLCVAFMPDAGKKAS
jgi:transcriptional regulator with XRE-family HTH domain